MKTSLLLSQRILIKKDKMLCVKADMTKQEDVDALAECTKTAFGSVDIYVNNAGQMGMS
ncbi:SDR family NAD(P)-dependent oxidoreductase [Tuberibacillus sp. Marseille-P3662]|uniref:SDR family NAD(P)-dependent oxidoreductase n=1 Tax=Tuberibacillus sp. Marseille-P3662 TaxID=1965358 RepID=UPI0034E8BB95